MMTFYLIAQYFKIAIFQNSNQSNTYNSSYKFRVRILNTFTYKMYKNISSCVSLMYFFFSLHSAPIYHKISKLSI